MRKFYIFLLGMFLGIAGCLMLSIFNEIPQDYIHATKTDTISVTEYKTIRDTIFVDKPKLYKEVVRDTVQLNMFVTNEGNYMVVTQKEYRDSNYVAWVSGVEPQLDSIMVFNNTEYVFKTSTIETVKTIEDNKGKLFTGAGIYMIENDFIPKLNIAYQKNNIIAGASVGIYNKKTIFGLDINIKLK